MSITTEEPRIDIPVSLVSQLIREQFPHWADLPISPVVPGGWDNRTFHLGSSMSVRMPSAKRYTHQTSKEYEWLPKLATQISVPIPYPLARGRASKEYPWSWLVYKWIEGNTADSLEEESINSFARDAAEFLIELHGADATGGPSPGPFYRGAPVYHYDSETRAAIYALQDLIDAKAVERVWELAIGSKWEKKAVWVHGDFSATNILVVDEKLSAVIDFGSCCVGDPACDLVLAWTFFSKESREIFKSTVGLDEDTWARARGWALWKALISVANLEDKKCQEAQENLAVIRAIKEAP